MAAVYYSTRFIIFQLSLSYNGIPTGWSSSGFRTNLVSVTCDLYGSWISLARWRNKIPWWLVWSEYNLVLHLPSDVKLEYDLYYSFFYSQYSATFQNFYNDNAFYSYVLSSWIFSYMSPAMWAHHRWESTWFVILVRINSLTSLLENRL